jgi:hypothetical protein
MKITVFQKNVVALSIAFLCLGNTSLQAQCKYKVVNQLSDTTSFSIPCDFPLKAITGDSALNENTFIAAFAAWNQNSASIQSLVLPTIATSGIKLVFFEIMAADFALYDDARKSLMLANPSLYKVLP